jgi:precorrin-2 dehydrogenase / sirohydrochlorin ferrochelatase
MSDEDMERLLGYYKPNSVPTLEQVRLGEELGNWGFDGSFGWAI